MFELLGPVVQDVVLAAQRFHVAGEARDLVLGGDFGGAGRLQLGLQACRLFVRFRLQVADRLSGGGDLLGELVVPGAVFFALLVGRLHLLAEAGDLGLRIG